jgi:ribosomal protein S18 acetylase RimI-like enzyme
MMVRVRTAEPADLAALTDIFRRSSLSNERDRPNLLAHPEVLELCETSIAERRTRVATVRGGRIVGFVTTELVADALELEDLFVDPDWMRRGIGRELIMDAMATARDRGIVRIVVTANPHARPFYDKAGFVYDGEAETRFGPAPRMHADVVVDG